ncbi:MAG: GNAT family N-acetyltransferase [Oscillatoriales cyanobacterium RM2_1_1]|nr:GNAT family N-acetyltransferase [Oscillatoriales cyanobacterium SM2_3_0]NJO47758.1 GNAT family N-acetyltransferase [Oscillatoriales cyanobacterium RM2_1_1]
MEIRIVIADYLDNKQAREISHLLNCYATDPMGGGQALDESVRTNLAEKLAQIPNAFSILGYVNHQAAGLINCFEGFSTFKCQPLINIHDVFVITQYRGLGLSQKMLSKVEEIAQERGCCKLTLEVLEGNSGAQRAYKKFGFSGYELDPGVGQALFWQKPIGC